MINFKPGMFFEFKDSVGKTTKVYDNHVVLQKASYGKTDFGYIFQQSIRKTHLNLLLTSGRARIIPWDEVLLIMLNKFKEKNKNEN